MKTVYRVIARHIEGHTDRICEDWIVLTERNHYTGCQGVQMRKWSIRANNGVLANKKVSREHGCGEILGAQV